MSQFKMKARNHAKVSICKHECMKVKASLSCKYFKRLCFLGHQMIVCCDENRRECVERRDKERIGEIIEEETVLIEVLFVEKVGLIGCRC